MLIDGPLASNRVLEILLIDNFEMPDSYLHIVSDYIDQNLVKVKELATLLSRSDKIYT